MIKPLKSWPNLVDHYSVLIYFVSFFNHTTFLLNVCLYSNPRQPDLG